MAKSKVSVTVYDVKQDLGTEYVNRKVTLHHEPTEKDEHCIAVKDESGKVLGFVAKQMGAALFATTFSKGVLDTYKGVKHFEGKVISSETLKLNGKDHQALKVEILGALSASKLSTEPKELLVSINTSTKYKGHKEALELFKNGNDVVVTLTKQDDEYVALYKGQVLGTLNESPSSDYAAFEKVTQYLDLVQTQETPLKSLNTRTMIGAMPYDTEVFKKEESKRATEAIQKQVDALCSAGITTRETLREIYKYLIENGVSSRNVLRVFQSMRQYKPEHKALIPQKPRVLYKEDAEALKDGMGLLNKSVVYINLGKHIRLEGPKGTGKNILVRTLAWIYQRPLWEVSMNKQMGLSELFGDKTLEHEGQALDLPDFSNIKDAEKREHVFQESMMTCLQALVNQKSNVVFKPEGFIQAMEASVHGGFVLVDEVNTSNPSLVAVLNAPLDDRRSVEVPGYGLVKGGENFCCIATMNAGYGASCC